MIRRIVLLGVVLPAVTAVTGLFGIATPAAAAGGGDVVIQCTAYLPHWPSAGEEGICDGPAGGGIVAGTVVVDCRVNFCSFTSRFGYGNPCPTTSVPLVPPVGSADGVFSITDGIDTIDGAFSWERIGAVASISLVVTSVDGLAASGDGVGAGTFIPTNGPGTCAAPMNSQTAVVVAHATFATITP